MADNSKAAEAQQFFMEQFVGFTHVPEPRVQEIYAKAMIMCARGDGELHAKERAWIRGYFCATGASDEVIALVDTYDGSEDVLDILAADQRTAKAAARNLVFDALRVCEADGELADAERASIHKMGKRMGLDAGAIRQVESAYEVYKAALANKMAVLFPNESPYQEA